MIINNDILYARAMDAIKELFSDQSVPQSKARENLETLSGEIEMMLDSLDE